tara:strand:- start:2978 stop:4087 length:1110 start_codon:yes stop_codon:yes gene_type:complete
MNKKHNNNLPIIINATSTIGSEPIAFMKVLSQPWIINIIEIIDSCNALDRLQIITPTKFKMEIKYIIDEHYPDNNISFIQKMPVNDIEFVVVDIKNMYWRRLLIKAIKKGKTNIESAIFSKITIKSDLIIAEDFSKRESAGHGTWVLRYVYRPIGYSIAKILYKTPVTPNMVTFLALIITLTSSILIALDSYYLGIIAAFLLHVFFVFDVVDGILSRLRKSNSGFGYWFDTITDTINNIGLILGFSFGAIISTGNFLYFIPSAIWIIGHVATSSDNIISTAAWAKTPKPSKVQKVENKKFGFIYIIKIVSRTLMNYTGRAEILAILYSVGLILNSENIILLLLSTIMFYRFAAMFILKYKNYLGNIKQL